MIDDRIIPETVNRINSYYRFEQRLEIQVIETKHCRYSHVFKIRVIAGDREELLYLKQVTSKYVAEDPVNSSVSREFDILRLLRDTFKNSSQLGVPEAVAVWPEENIIITANVEGPSLMSLISRGTRVFSSSDRMRRLEEQCNLCGLWLQRFQAATSDGTATFDLESLRLYCRIRLDLLLENRGSLVDTAFRDEFLSFLDREAARIKKSENKISGRHNDFSPHNIIVEGEKIVTLDFGYFDHDSFAYDIYRFWHQIECMKFSPIFSQDKVSRLQRNFLLGFGQTIDLACPLYRVVGCRFYLTRLATIIDEGKRSGLRGLIDLRVYRACYNWLRHTCRAS